MQWLSAKTCVVCCYGFRTELRQRFGLVTRCIVLSRGVKFTRNPGPAPDRYRTKLDGPSIKPSIHIRADHQARWYILSALRCSFCAQQLALRPCKSPAGFDFGPSAGPMGSNLTSLVLKQVTEASRRFQLRLRKQTSGTAT